MVKVLNYGDNLIKIFQKKSLKSTFKTPLSAYLYMKIENSNIMSFNIEKILGKEANYLLDHKCNTVKKEHLHLPGPDFVDRVMTPSDRNPVVLRNMQTLFN
ncbi:MAG: hypothetical protein WBN27_08665, partial [Eudoraea sp.]